jgi:hypothetical protein
VRLTSRRAPCRDARRGFLSFGPSPPADRWACPRARAPWNCLRPPASPHQSPYHLPHVPVRSRYPGQTDRPGHPRPWLVGGSHCREVTLGAVEIVNGKGRRRSSGRTDYTLRIRVNTETQPVALALIEAKKESLPPGHGLDQAKGYLAASRHNVQFVFSSNGHLFVEFDRSTGLTTAPRPIAEFPTPAELRARYETIVGFSLDAPAALNVLAKTPRLNTGGRSKSIGYLASISLRLLAPRPAFAGRRDTHRSQ